MPNRPNQDIDIFSKTETGGGVCSDSLLRTNMALRTNIDPDLFIPKEAIEINEGIPISNALLMPIIFSTSLRVHEILAGIGL